MNMNYSLPLHSANKKVSEYGDYGKQRYHRGWGGGSCGSTDCGGEWCVMEHEDPTYELTDFYSLTDSPVTYNGLTMDLSPEDDLMIY